MYITDPNMQLLLMQQTGYSGFPGFPGFASPTAGAGNLAATAAVYGPAITGNAVPDTSPLAPLGMQNFGLPGMMLGLTGNVYLSNRLEQAGLMSMGNAASMQQAIEARQLQQIQRQVASSIASQDASGIYRFLRGSAAVAGLPFNANQRLAAQQMASGIAQYGPMLSLAVPGGSEILDLMSGPTGSVQAMASQMMEANRYRIDPLTGRYGLGGQANTEMISNVFSNMFAEDNMARMQGLRAGDVGQLYRALSAEGLAGPTLSLRDRTLNALTQARRENADLSGIANEAGIAPDLLQGDLNKLSGQQLAQLRGSKSMQDRITKTDARQISDQLQEYVDSIAAMREVFGEAGNPDAPMPQLIGALKALTNGQMQRFDPASLTTMVRNMQAMSQMSGKSIDQILAMNQSANAMNTSILGSHAANFNPAVVQAGLAGGIAFSQAGAATGFGALNRQQAEQATMNLFSRGLGSETSQAMGALLRVQQSGGFAGNQAGQQLSAIMSAAAAGQDYYEFNGTRMSMPTSLNEFRSLVSQGGIAGGDVTTFNMMLTDTTANFRALAENPEMQKVAFQQQQRQINKKLAQTMGYRLESETTLRQAMPNNAQRAAAANSISSAGLNALNSLTPAEMQRPGLRISAMAEAIRAEASTYGINLSEAEARTMAASQFGQAESTIQSFGFESFTAYAQVHGRQVSSARTAADQAASVRAGTNAALGEMQNTGGVLGRFGAALHKMGERAVAGGDKGVNMDALLAATFGSGFNLDAANLSAPLQEVKGIYEELRSIEGQFVGADPARQKELQKEASDKLEQLKKAIGSANQAVDSSEIGSAQAMAKLALGDYSEDAKKLGITEAEYLDAIKSGKLPESLKSISNPEVLAKARAAENTIATTDREIAMYKSDLESKDPVRRGRAESATAALRAKRNEAIRDKESGMRAMGLTPGNPEHEKTYQEQLANQGSIAMLKKRAETWASSNASLLEKGLNPEQSVNNAIAMEKEARDREKEEQAKVLATSELNTIADSLGLDKSTDRQNLAKDLTGEKDDSSDANVANQKLVASVFDRLNKIGDKDVSAVKKLDQLTDRYKAAKDDPKALALLAKEYKMSTADLGKMMKQTAFLGMEEKTDPYTAQDLVAAMSESRYTDQAGETAENRNLTISGVLEFKGDVMGQGTLAGNTGALGN